MDILHTILTVLFVFLSMHPDWADASVIPWLAGALVVFMLLGVAASMTYLRKL
jgi:hypothetical protein